MTHQFMRSPSGFAANIVFLLGSPIAALALVIVGKGADTVIIHLALGITGNYGIGLHPKSETR
jgi:hypothetical protein